MYSRIRHRRLVSAKEVTNQHRCISRNLSRMGTTYSPCPDTVIGFLPHEGEDVGADVPAAEGVEVPVCFHGGDGAVVVVETGVGGALEGGGDGVAEEEGEHPVLVCVGFAFVEG